MRYQSRTDMELARVRATYDQAAQRLRRRRGRGRVPGNGNARDPFGSDSSAFQYSGGGSSGGGGGGGGGGGFWAGSTPAGYAPGGGTRNAGGSSVVHPFSGLRRMPYGGAVLAGLQAVNAIRYVDRAASAAVSSRGGGGAGATWSAIRGGNQIGTPTGGGGGVTEG